MAAIVLPLVDVVWLMQVPLPFSREEPMKKLVLFALLATTAPADAAHAVRRGTMERCSDIKTNPAAYEAASNYLYGFIDGLATSRN
jgi:hypothetical protein